MAGDLKTGWAVQLIITLAVVVLGLFLVKRGAKLLFEYFQKREERSPDAPTRNVFFGIGLTMLGVLLIVSFLMSSPLAFMIFK